MKVSIAKSKIGGHLAAPPSKSYTIRGLMCAALAKGKSQLIHPLHSDDTTATCEVLKIIGVELHDDDGCWRILGGNLKPSEEELFCHDSAATLRFMTAVCSTIQGHSRLTSGQSLAHRPIDPLLGALQQLGVDCRAEGSAVIVDGSHLKGGTVEIPGDISSQFISALMLIAPLAKDGTIIRLTVPPESRPYLLMTMECMARFGIVVKASEELALFEIQRQPYHPAKYEVEGDWSSASYFLSLGAICEGITVSNLNRRSLQGDKIMLNLLKNMGAHVSLSHDSVSVSRWQLKAIKANLNDCIDLLPTLAVLAAMAKGQSCFEGIERARVKESNRVTAVREGLEKMGVDVTEERDKLIICGGQPKGAVIDSKNDHRIAMAFSILGVAVGDTVIDGAECVAKTYPDYWEVLKSIGGEIETDGQ
jgi:3-phosphoshikimate 1-carboxyvinyltransferase